MFDSFSFKKIFSNKKIIVFSIVILIVLLVLLFSNYGIIKRVALEKNKRNLQEKIILQNKKLDSLKNQINKLENDTNEIERIARENYGMAKPNEKVYFIKK